MSRQFIKPKDNEIISLSFLLLINLYFRKNEVLIISMNFTSFTQFILTCLQEELGNDYTVLSGIVNKNNGVRKTGVTIRREGQNVFPTIYIDEFYRENLTEKEIRQVAGRLLESFAAAELEEKVDLSGFTEFSKAREGLAFKLVSAEKNKKLLKTIPHKVFHNLAIVFYYTVQEAPFYGNAAVLVNNHHMRQWGTNPGELLSIAGSNTPKLFPWLIDSMEEIMRGMLAEDLSRERRSDKPDVFPEKGKKEKNWAEELVEQIAADFTSGRIPMYVLTNRQKINGAACMLYPDVLRLFGEKLGRDFYILPSSVHELILVPDDESISKEALWEIVTDINRTQVAEEEILADSIYFYDRKKDRILWLL